MEDGWQDFRDIIMMNPDLHPAERDVRAQNQELRRELQEARDQLHQAQLQAQNVQNFAVVAPAPRQEEHHDRDGLSIPLFYGRPGENFLDWLSFYDTVGTIKGWDDDRKKQILPARLRETAWQAYQAIPQEQRDTYLDLKQVLTDKFMGGHHKRSNVLGFAKRKQKHGESAEQFAMALQTAFQMAYPTRNPTDYDDELQLRFEEGALDGDRVTELGPNSFADAVSKAVNIEAAKQKRQEKLNAFAWQTSASIPAVGAIAATVGTSQLEAITRKLNELTTKIERKDPAPARDSTDASYVMKELLKIVKDGNNSQAAPQHNWVPGPPNNNRGGDSQGRPKCQRCQRVGHNAYDCTTPFCTVHQFYGHSTENCNLNRRRQRENRNQKYCANHQTYGHATEECRRNRNAQNQLGGAQHSDARIQPPTQYTYHRNQNIQSYVAEAPSQGITSAPSNNNLREFMSEEELFEQANRQYSNPRKSQCGVFEANTQNAPVSGNMYHEDEDILILGVTDEDRNLLDNDEMVETESAPPGTPAEVLMEDVDEPAAGYVRKPRKTLLPAPDPLLQVTRQRDGFQNKAAQALSRLLVAQEQHKEALHRLEEMEKSESNTRKSLREARFQAKEAHKEAQRATSNLKRTEQKLEESLQRENGFRAQIHDLESVQDQLLGEVNALKEERLEFQRLRTQVVEQTAENGRILSRLDGTSTGSFHLPLGLLGCTTLFVLAGLCCVPAASGAFFLPQTTAGKQIFKIPRTFPCAKGLTTKHDKLELAMVDMYKRNHIQYRAKAYVCKTIVTEIRSLTYFFNDERLREVDKNTIPTSSEQCKHMQKFKESLQGSLVARGSVWKTVNEADWTYPGGGANCCYWKIASMTNSFLYEAFMYKRHGSPVMESTAGVVSHCHYDEGNCVLKDGTALIWKPDPKEHCEFLPWKTFDGHRMGNTWLATDGNLALTFANDRTSDCTGRRLIMSHQGISFRLHSVRKTRQIHSQAIVHQISKRAAQYRRANRGDQPEKDGLVTTDILAASLEAVQLDLQKNIRFAFTQALSETCRSMKATVKILRASILANPTLTMRALLQREDIIAHSSTGAIEIWPCSVVPAKDVFFLPMNGTCTREIPIEFVLDGHKNQGFIDPRTNIIIKTGFPTDCALNQEIPLFFDNQTRLYQSRSGELQNADHLTEMRLFDWNATALAPFHSTVFHQVVMYNWSELQTHITLNDLMGSLSAQRQLFSELGVHSHGNPSLGAKQLLANIGARSFFGFLSGLNFDPWQVWTFCCCVAVTVFGFSWCCCPTCLNKVQLNLAATIVNLYQSVFARSSANSDPEAPSVRMSDLHDEHDNGYPRRNNLAEFMPPRENSVNAFNPPPSYSAYPTVVTQTPNRQASTQITATTTEFSRARSASMKVTPPPWKLLRAQTPESHLIGGVFANSKTPTRSLPKNRTLILGCLLVWTSLVMAVSVATFHARIALKSMYHMAAKFLRNRIFLAGGQILAESAHFFNVLGHIKDDYQSGHATLVEGRIQGTPTPMLLDTGATISIISAKLAQQLDCHFEKSQTFAISMSNANLPFIASAAVKIEIKGMVIQHRVHVMRDSPRECLLGTDALEKFGPLTFDFNRGTVRISKSSPIELNGTKTEDWKVKLEEDSWLRPRTETFVYATIEEGPSESCTLLVESSQTLTQSKGVLVSKSIHSSHQKKFPVKILNPNPFRVRLYANQTLGTASFVYPPEVVSMVSSKLNASQTQLSSVESLDLSGTGLSPTQQTQLKSLLEKYPDCFATSDFDLGNTSTLCHKIDTGNNRPFKQRMHRIPFADRPAVKQHLDNMVEHGVIEPSTSPYASPIVVVRKKSGEIRICGDFRCLNEHTLKDTYPLPCIDELLDTVGAANYYTTLDLCAGFWQIPLEKESREKTAVTTPFGLFHYLRLPFGLTNSPATFQRLMETVLSGLSFECAQCYVDDVIIFTKGSFEKHLEDIAKVLDRLRQHGLKLKLKKCHWAQLKLEFLGHTISAAGIQPNDAKIEAVKHFPKPENLTDVRAFLGLAGFYRKFIKNFAKIAHPLTELLRKDKKFVWSPSCEAAFQELKDRLTSAPILQFPDFNKDFKLSLDACDTGLGVVLSQKGDDEIDHPVAYASRTVIKAEKSYSTPEKEALAIVFGLTHFRPYLIGHNVLVATDHSPLRFLQTHKNPNTRLQRWSLFISQFDITEIVYNPGRNNKHADGLSRRPLPAKETEEWDERFFQLLPDFSITKIVPPPPVVKGPFLRVPENIDL